MSEISIALTQAEIEALKKAFPDMEAGAAAEMVLRQEMKRRYKRDLQAGTVVRLKARASKGKGAK